MRAEAYQQWLLQQQLLLRQQETLALAQEPSTPTYHPDSSNSSDPADPGLRSPEYSLGTRCTNQYNGPSYTLVMSQMAGQLRNPRSPEPRSKPASSRVSSSSRMSGSSTSNCLNGRLTSRAPDTTSNMPRASSQPLPAGIGSCKRSGSTSPFSGKYKFTAPTAGSGGSSSKSANTSPEISPRRRSTVQSAVAIQKLAVSLADAGIEDPEVLALAACYKTQGDASVSAAAAEQQQQQQQQQGEKGAVPLVPGGHDSGAGSSPFSLSGAMNASLHTTTVTGMAYGDPNPIYNAAAAASSSINGSSRRSAASSSLSKSVAGRVLSIFGNDSIPADVTAAAAAAATNIRARAAAAAAAAAASKVVAAAPDASDAAAAVAFCPRGVATRPLSPSVAAAAASAAARPVSVAAAAALVASEEIVGIPLTKMQLPTLSPAVHEFFAAAAVPPPAPPATPAAAAVTLARTAAEADSSSDAQDAAAAAAPSTIAAATRQAPAAVLLCKDTGSIGDSVAVSAAGATSCAASGAGNAAAADSKLASNTTVSDLQKQLEDLQQSLTAAKEAGAKEAAGIAAARLAVAEKAAAASPAAGSAGGCRSSARDYQSVASGDDNVSLPVRQRAPSAATLMGTMEADRDGSAAGAAAAAAAAAAARPVMRRTLGAMIRSNTVKEVVVPTGSRSDLGACNPKIAEDQCMINNIGCSNEDSKLETGGSAFSSCSWGSANSSTHTAIGGSSPSRAALPLSYEPQIRSDVSDPRVPIDPMLRPSGSPLKSIAEQHELLTSHSSSNGIEEISTGATTLTDNSSSNLAPQDGATGLRIKVRSDSKLTGSTPVSEVERSDPQTWANTFFPGSATAAEAAVTAATGAAATAVAIDGNTSKRNALNTTSTGVSLFVTEVKVASSAAQHKDKTLRGSSSSSSGDGSCSSGGSFWRIGTCSLPSLSTAAFHKYHPRNDHSTSSKKWTSRKVFLRILLPLLLLLPAVIGIGAWVGAKHQRAKVAAMAVQQLGFEAVLVTPSADGNKACGRWFASAELVYLYRRVFAASYASALGVDMTAFDVTTITCGGSTIFTSSSSSTSSGSGSRAHARLLMAAAARPDNLAAAVSQQPVSLSGNASLMATQAAAAAADQDNALKTTGFASEIEIITIFNVPAPTSAKDSITKAIAAASAGILISPLSKFFDGPTALRGAVRSLSPAAAAAAAASGSAVPIGENPGEVLSGGSGSSSGSTGNGSSSSNGSSSGTQISTAAAAVGSSANGSPQSVTYAPGTTAAAAAAATAASDKNATHTTADTTAVVLTPPSAAAAPPAAPAPAKQQHPKQRHQQGSIAQQQQQHHAEQDVIPAAAQSKQPSLPEINPSDVQNTPPPSESVAAAAAEITTASAMRMKKPAAAAAGGRTGASKLPSPPPLRSSPAAKVDNDPVVLDDTASVTAAIATAASRAPKKAKVKAHPAAPAPAAAAPAPEPEVPVTADPVVIIDNPVITVKPTAAGQSNSKKDTAPTVDIDTFSPPTIDPTATAGEADPVPVAEAQPVVVVPEQPATQRKPTKGTAGNTFDPVYTPYDKSNSKSSATACPFAATKTNSYADSDGQLWGFADGNKCMFKKQ